MSNSNDGGSAFPEPINAQCGGMSIRDYFAAKAMQGLVATFDGMTSDDIAESIPAASAIAYAMADAMLKERIK